MQQKDHASREGLHYDGAMVVRSQTQSCRLSGGTPEIEGTAWRCV